MVLGETSYASRGSNPETNWVSHPLAIGYRRAGSIPGSSSGSFIAIPAVEPEFDSGMNEGSNGEELERITNFYSGAEENPTAAQLAPTPRVEELAVGNFGFGNGGNADGGGSSYGGVGGQPINDNSPYTGPMGSNLGNEMNVGGYFGSGMIKQWARVLDALGILPPGFGGGDTPDPDPGNTPDPGEVTPPSPPADPPLPPSPGTMVTPDVPNAQITPPTGGDDGPNALITPPTGGDDGPNALITPPASDSPESDTGQGSWGDTDGGAIVGADGAGGGSWDSGDDVQTEPPGGWSSPLVAGVGGFFAGLGQGVLNTLNGLQDDAINMVIHDPIDKLNNTVGLIPGVPQIPRLESPDWSNGRLTDEDPRLHPLSKKAGAFGVEMLATLGAGAVAGEAKAATIVGEAEGVGAKALAEAETAGQNLGKGIQAPKSGEVAWNNGWRTADGKFASPLGPGRSARQLKARYGMRLRPSRDGK